MCLNPPPKTAPAGEENLLLDIKSPSDVGKLPRLYVEVMVDAAGQMVSDCPK